MNILISSSLDFVSGAALGYRYVLSRKEEKEIIQGKNYYVAAPALSDQIALLASLISHLSQTIFLSSSLKDRINSWMNVASFLGHPLAFLAASVKHENYTQVDLGARISPPPQLLPSKKSIIRLLKIFSEQGGDWIRIAFAGVSLGLMMHSQKAFSAGILCALGYDFLEERHLVAKKVSLFVESYMPYLFFVGAWVKGNLYLKLVTLFELSSLCSYEITCFYQQIADRLLRYFFEKLFDCGLTSRHFLTIPSISEIDRPPTTKVVFTYKTICSILEMPKMQFDHFFKINFFACTQAAFSASDFPKDDQFEKLLAFFDQSDWLKNSSVIIKKLQDDERFIEFLQKKMDENSTKEEIQQNFYTFISALAKKENISAEQYVIDWTKAQLTELVDVLKGRLKVKGKEADVLTAVSHASILLPYMTSIGPGIEREDMLLKIAIEGGGYCGLGIKRVWSELLASFIAIQLKENGSSAPKNYENQVLYALEKHRNNLVDHFHKKSAELIFGKSACDIHIADLFRLIIGFGFIPMPKSARMEMGLTSVVQRYFSAAGQLPFMYHKYQKTIYNELNDIGVAHFTEYLRAFLQNNPLLSPEQQDDLLEMYTGEQPITEDSLSANEIVTRFQRLLLIKLGVLTFKKSPAT